MTTYVSLRLGTSSWLDWQINFTHMLTVKCFNDLLVCTFSGWVEADITTNKSIHCHHPSALYCGLLHWVAHLPPARKWLQTLQIPWHFHIPCHPWASVIKQQTYRTLKEVSIYQAYPEPSPRLDQASSFSSSLSGYVCLANS